MITGFSTIDGEVKEILPVTREVPGEGFSGKIDGVIEQDLGTKT